MGAKDGNACSVLLLGRACFRERSARIGNGGCRNCNKLECGLGFLRSGNVERLSASGAFDGLADEAVVGFKGLVAMGAGNDERTHGGFRIGVGMGFNLPITKFRRGALQKKARPFPSSFPRP